MDEITRGLDRFRGNTLDVSPYNTREENYRIIPGKNNRIKEGRVLILGFLIHLP